MTRLLIAAGFAVSLAACSTTGTPTHVARYENSTGYAFKTDIDNKRTNPKNKVEESTNAPRLGFNGFSGTQVVGGIN